ncbi:MAG: hypothetical protein ABJX32_04825 [Tateyamaria sp.]|uniref:hypothetical protein n=1 Tax=Tateyamaria sp. TaxID=1929288 RepID=UPI00329B3572
MGISDAVRFRIAAERTGRVARVVELDPIYCDVTCRRYAALTGETAVLATTGESFEEVEKRLAENAMVPAVEAAE